MEEEGAAAAAAAAGSCVISQQVTDEICSAEETDTAPPSLSPPEKRKLEDETLEDKTKKLKTDSTPDGSGEESLKVTTSQCEVSSSSPERIDVHGTAAVEEEMAEPSQEEGSNKVQNEEPAFNLPEAAADNSDITKDGDGATETPAEETKPAEKVDEVSNVGAESAPEEEMDETASKLLASGISISLIKKKKEEKKAEEVDEVDREDETEKEKHEEPTNPLEVGPNISVTMINKGNSDNQNSSKFTLSLKSQSELLDPRKGENKAQSANILGNGVGDAISVSRVSRSPAVSSPGPTSAKPTPGSKPSSCMLGSPPGRVPLLSQPHGMPGLQPRPNGAVRSTLPLATGSVSEQLNSVASGITEYMRHGIEEVLRELSAQGSPEATIKGLQLELEKLQWRHQQELAEVKQSIDIMLKEMKANMAKESQRTIEEFKKQAELEKQKAVLETKKKQWCAACGKEAIFYCCWNTSYCDYPCQQAHWPSHMATCSQSNQEEEPQAQEILQEHKPVQSVTSSALLNSLTRQSNPMGMNSMGMNSVGMSPNGMGFVMPGMGMSMRPGMGMRSPMGVSIRPGMPGQLTISRPYFM